MTLALTDKVDLDVYYIADSVNIDAPTLAVVTRDVFKRMFGPCQSRGFAADGVAFGGVIFDGVRPHVAVLPEWKGRWAPLLRPVLRWLYSLSDDMVVPVYDDNPDLVRFVARCGWPMVGRQPGAALHRMTPWGARGLALIEPSGGAKRAAGALGQSGILRRTECAPSDSGARTDHPFTPGSLAPVKAAATLQAVDHERRE